MKYCNILSVCNIEIGKTPARKEKTFWGKGYKWVSIADMKSKYIERTKEEITKEAVFETKIKIVPKDTVIMSFKLSIGKVAIAKSELYTNEAIVAFHIIKPDKLYHTFLYYALQTIRLCDSSDRAVMGQTLNKRKLSKLFIPLPPLPIQKKIVAVLDKAQELIDLRKQQIEKLDELIKSVFYDMFGDPVTNPKNLLKVKIGDFFDTSSGGTPAKKISEYWMNGDIPWIGSNMCKNEIIRKNDGKFITKLGLSKSSAKIFPIGTVLVALVGATIGKTALLDFETATNQNIAGIIIKDVNIYNPMFVFFYLQSIYTEFMSIGQDKFKMANLAFIRNLEIYVVPIKKQNRFVEKVEKIEADKKLIKQSLHQLENNYQSLQQRAFKGELF
ncbi:MAG: restriction endonuclease subunit S [Candidatus Stygibacter frigidus]|nr:restriction endonuclease subunit S [Candidatus Stygibacter frigidus]